MTDLEQLVHYMAPYYQEAGDLVLLQQYLDKYTYPECAASKLWYELGGKIGLESEGILKVSSGAEKTEYGAPGTMQLACKNQGDYYADLCNALNNIGSVAVKVSKATVGGIPEEYGSTDE